MAALALGRKQPGARRRGRREFVEQRAIEPHRRARRLRNRHEPLLVALAAHGDQRLLVARGRFGQRDQFGDAQAGGVDQLDQAGHARSREPFGRRAARGVEAFARDVDQPLDLGLGQHLRQRARTARAFDRQRRIVAAPALEIEMLVELPHRGEPARERRDGEPRGGSVGLKCAECRRSVAVEWRRAAPGEKFGVGRQVAPVGLDRVARRVALGSDGVEEILDQPTRGAAASFRRLGDFDDLRHFARLHLDAVDEEIMAP